MPPQRHQKRRSQPRKAKEFVRPVEWFREPPIDWSVLLRLFLILPIFLVPVVEFWNGEKGIWKYVVTGLNLVAIPSVLFSDDKLRRVLRAIFTKPTVESKVPMEKR